MDIRHAKPEDMPRLLELYARARQFMHTSGNPNQWTGGYPSEQVLEADMRAGNLYAAEVDGTIEGGFAFIGGEDPTYRYIDGRWINDAPYHTIHRITTSGRVKGLSAQIFAWCARQAGGSLRADTHEDNAPMRHVLEKFGFVYCGTIYLADGSPRRAYQYIEK